MQWRLPIHPHMPLADILCSDDLGMPELFEALLPALERNGGGSWDALVFDPVLAESPLATVGAVRGGGIHASIVKTCDEIPCGMNVDSFRSRFSRNLRSNLNKARNKLAREPAVEFGTAARPGELEDALAGFMDLEASGWKGR